jgi:hypothetical protein
MESGNPALPHPLPCRRIEETEKPSIIEMILFNRFRFPAANSFFSAAAGGGNFFYFYWRLIFFPISGYNNKCSFESCFKSSSQFRFFLS